MTAGPETAAPPAPHPAVETAFLAPEAVLYDARHHRVHHLNPSASAVWLLVDGELTADQIASELSEIFETPIEVIRPDVDDALAEFARRGLLTGESTDDEPAHDHEHPHEHDTDPADHGVTSVADDEVTVLPRPPDP